MERRNMMPLIATLDGEEMGYAYSVKHSCEDWGVYGGYNGTCVYLSSDGGGFGDGTFNSQDIVNLGKRRGDGFYSYDHYPPEAETINRPGVGLSWWYERLWYGHNLDY